MPDFRWQGKYLFLTWPQSDFDLDGAIHRLREQGGRNVTFIRLCSERHQCGALHRHALLCFGKRVSFTDERRFDIDDRHPKWERYTRAPARAAHYVGNPEKPGYVAHVDWGEVPDFAAAEPGESRSALWGRLLDEATDPDSFMSSVREHAPYEFCTKFQALHSMATTVFQRRSPHTSQFDLVDDFRLPDTIENWMEKEFDQEVGETIWPDGGGGVFPAHASLSDSGNAGHLEPAHAGPLFFRVMIFMFNRFSMFFTRTGPYDQNHSSSSATLVRERNQVALEPQILAWVRRGVRSNRQVPDKKNFKLVRKT